MDTLNRISSTFKNVRNTIKSKDSSERLQILKKDLQNIQNELALLGQENQDQYIRSLAMEGYLALLSVKAMPLSLTEKKNILNTAYQKLKQFRLREECLFIFLRIQNLLCYYMVQLDQTILAREILESTEEIYDKISSAKPDTFLDVEDLFKAEPIQNIKSVDPEKIDKVITNNIQMQAFIYNKMNQPLKYTLYNHTVLRRQLEMKEGTPQEWAVRTSRLGNYFTYHNQLENARYHLCAAYHVLRTCHDNCKLMPEEFVLQKADFEIHFLELSHYWVKYGLTLFKLSKRRILKRYFSRSTSKSHLWHTIDGLKDEIDYNNTDKTENTKDIGSEKCKGDILRKPYEFPTLNLDEIENKVPIEFINSVEDARRLFTFTHKWLMRAKHYYDFEHHSAQYTSCSLQLAELYEHLAFFEKSVDNQYQLQKKRADVLEALNSLLKTCDTGMSVQIDVIRELSQVQLELMALNLQKLWHEESHTNFINMDADAESIINSLDSDSNKTLTEKTLNTSCKNMFLRKMEATTAITGKLFRLSSQLGARTPSEVSFGTSTMRN